MSQDPKSTTDTARRVRLEVRIRPEQKALIQRAADLAGLSLTEFVVSRVQAAEETIRNHESMVLTERESRMVVAALLNPPEPNEALRAAARRLDTRIAE